MALLVALVGFAGGVALRAEAPTASQHPPEVRAAAAGGL